MKKWLLVLVSLLIIPAALADSYDLNLTVVVGSTLQVGNTTSLFKVTNLNYTIGQPEIDASIIYNIFYSNGTCLPNKCNRTLQANGFKQYKTVGSWTPGKSGNFNICGNITNSSVSGTENNDTDLNNNFACKVVSVESQQENVKLSVNLDSPALTDLGYTSLFKIEIEYKENCASNKDDDVSVYYNITELNGTLIKDDTFTATQIGCSKTANTGDWTPQQPGNYILCGQITSSTVNESDFSDNSACKNITVVQNPLTVLSVPLSSNWGSSNLMLIEFNTTYYGYNKTKFLIYGAQKRVVTDLSWTKITSYSQCQGDTAVEIQNSPNQTYYLLLPFFLYPNCDDYYSDGSHELALRICNPKSDPTQFEKWADYLFYVSISGKNSALCPSLSSKSSSQTAATMSSTSSSNLDVEILEAPTNATQGQIFTIKIKITNNYNSTKSFPVYSYAYQGHNLVTEGGWTGNKQDVTLAASSTKTLELANAIKQDSQPGVYTFKVRAKVDGKDIDAIQSIQILKGENQTQEIEEKAQAEQSSIVSTSSENKTTAKEQPKDGELITGAVVWASKTNRNLSLAMLVFIAALLVLVTALLISLTRKPKR